MRILVAGATGYIGSRLVPELLRRGHEVVAASSSVPDPDRFGWDERVRAIRCDVTDAEVVAGAVRDVDAVVYLVHGLSGDDFREKDRQAAQNVADAVTAAGVERAKYDHESGTPKPAPAPAAQPMRFKSRRRTP